MLESGEFLAATWVQRFSSAGQRRRRRGSLWHHILSTGLMPRMSKHLAMMSAVASQSSILHMLTFTTSPGETNTQETHWGLQKLLFSFLGADCFSDRSRQMFFFLLFTRSKTMRTTGGSENVIWQKTECKTKTKQPETHGEVEQIVEVKLRTTQTTAGQRSRLMRPPSHSGSRPAQHQMRLCDLNICIHDPPGRVATRSRGQ